MKKKIATLMATLLLGGSLLTLQAGNDKDASATRSNNTSSTIQNFVQLPEQFRRQGFEEKVKVLFTVNAEGEVENVLCVCPHPDLKAAVEMQFKRLQFGETKINTLYTVNINFKVI